jgi:hypothetical protein
MASFTQNEQKEVDTTTRFLVQHYEWTGQLNQDSTADLIEFDGMDV